MQTSAPKRRRATRFYYFAYVPIDEWLEQPRVRALRALRFFSDGITAEELGDVLDLPAGGNERRALATALGRSVRAGEVTCTVRVGAASLYQLAPGFRLAPPALPKKRRTA